MLNFFSLAHVWKPAPDFLYESCYRIFPVKIAAWTWTRPRPAQPRLTTFYKPSRLFNERWTLPPGNLPSPKTPPPSRVRETSSNTTTPKKKFQCIDDALHSLEDIDIEAAKERLLEASALLTQRQKLIRLADRSPLGWATVKEYIADDLAENSDDEKRLRKAEKAAATKRAETAKKSKIQPPFRAPRSSVPPHIMPGTFRRFNPYRPETRICFQCGIAGHVRPNCPALRAARSAVNQQQPSKAPF
ncbi:uncharacterized protein LOC135153930 [Lytechinus pictus]|uniref:uncharacterized protein LOC135153930 n=1 Tax=Lytechinus pictus TaxID=7653 RepID=UPI0030B9FDC9